MKLLSKLLLLAAFLFTLSFSRPSFAGQPGRQQVITCASNNGRRNFCQADTRGGVQLRRQFSGSPCVRDQTWGWDRGGIWVDRGCRAEFMVGGPPRRGPGRTIICASNNNRRNFCDIDLRGGNVILNRQISGTPCIRDQTWGVDRRGIWVDRGCRAEFLIR